MLTYNTQLKKLLLPEYGRNIQQMVDHCLTIEDREERKESRGRVVGGGFGLGGALTGMATAGAMNAVSGAGHSIINAIGNASSEWEAKVAKKKLYESDDTISVLKEGIKDST